MNSCIILITTMMSIHQAKDLPFEIERFTVADRPAFVMLPEKSKRTTPQPWILYAPNLPGYPDRHEAWMHQKFLDAGVAVAGVDIGEAYGNPKGRITFSALHQELVKKRQFTQKPCLFGRSRGGLWVTSWAADNPEKVAGIIGIYPVFDFRTYPGITKAAAAYGLSPDELKARSKEFNPIEKVQLLARAKIPATLIHGDDDKVVPLKENSQAFLEAYQKEKQEGLVKLIILKGQGHNYYEGFFKSQEIVDFAISKAKNSSP